MAQLEDDVDDPTTVHVCSGYRGRAGGQRSRFAVCLACEIFRPALGSFGPFSRM